jgi:tRNA threonylcarbamoyladenosine biosynthesis protein TsaE
MKHRKFGRIRSAISILSRSPEETQRIGAELARSLSVPGVVLLKGALGTGKTTLTRGSAQGFGVTDTGLVTSPSFTLINTYRGTCPVYHVDLYRLQGERDLHSIGLDDFLGKDGITIIEWSERLPYSVEHAMEIEIEDAGDDLRILHIASHGLRRGSFLRPGAGRGNRKWGDLF